MLVKELHGVNLFLFQRVIGRGYGLLDDLSVQVNYFKESLVKKGHFYSHDGSSSPTQVLLY